MGWVSVSLGLLLGGCSDGTGDTAADSDVVEDSGLAGDTSDSASGSDSADSQDTGEERIGLSGRIGTAIVDDKGFRGTEDLYFVADYGEGEDICRIRYTLTTIGSRTDCDECEWAYDLQLSGPELISEVEPGCLSTVGIDSTSIDVLDAQIVSYGYNPDYFGHIAVLFVEQDGVWGPVDHGAWDRDDGSFVYDWQDGYEAY